MAKNDKSKAAATERRKARTLDEQIAELEAKKVEREAKAKAKAEEALAKAIAVRDTHEARFRKAEANVARLRKEIGLDVEAEAEVRQAERAAESADAEG